MGLNSLKPRRNAAVAATADTSRGPSSAIWGRIPLATILDDRSNGFFFPAEDWMKTPVLVSPTITTQVNYGSGWKAFGSTAGTIAPATPASGSGGLALASGANDNDGISIATIALPFRIDRGFGRAGVEARLKTSTIGDTTQGWFFGLGDQMTLTAIVPITAAGVLADQNLLGFHRKETTGSKIDLVYRANGVTAVTVVADAIPTGLALAADTFIKLGMLFEPYGIFGNNYVSWWINGVFAGKVQVPVGQGTDMPNDVQMGVVFGGVNAAGASVTDTIDWVQAAQLYV